MTRNSNNGAGRGSGAGGTYPLDAHDGVQRIFTSRMGGHDKREDYRQPGIYIDNRPDIHVTVQIANGVDVPGGTARPQNRQANPQPEPNRAERPEPEQHQPERPEPEEHEPEQGQPEQQQPERLQLPEQREPVRREPEQPAPPAAAPTSLKSKIAWGIIAATLVSTGIYNAFISPSEQEEQPTAQPTPPPPTDDKQLPPPPTQAGSTKIPTDQTAQCLPLPSYQFVYNEDVAEKLKKNINDSNGRINIGLDKNKQRAVAFPIEWLMETRFDQGCTEHFAAVMREALKGASFQIIDDDKNYHTYAQGNVVVPDMPIDASMFKSLTATINNCIKTYRHKPQDFTCFIATVTTTDKEGKKTNEILLDPFEAAIPVNDQGHINATLSGTLTSKPNDPANT